MKELVVLFSVLALTSAASGAIIAPWISSLNGEPIEPTQEITIGESDVINFDIVYFPDGAQDLMSLDTIVDVDGLGTLDLGALTYPYAPPPPVIQEIWPGKEYEIGFAFFDGMGAGILIDHFLLHCDQGFPANDVIVSLSPALAYGGTIYVDGVTPYDGQWGSILIHNVPEPATIVLFGVGGVLLLRRRLG